MLLTAVYKDNENNVLKQAVLNNRNVIEGKNPTETFVSLYLRDKDPKVIKSYSYGRYWHGYLIFLKPLLIFFNYGEIRYINMMIQMGLILYLIYLLTAHNKSDYGIPVLFYVLSINYAASAMSLQFASVLILTMFSMVVFLLKEEYYLGNENSVAIHFLISGCLTSYFDLLTYPLHTLAIPMAIWVAILGKERYRTALKLVVSWGFGYAGMWGGKWMLGSAVTGANVFADALEQAKVRTSYTASDKSFTYIDMIKRMLSAINFPIILMVLVVAFIYILYCMIHHNAGFDKSLVSILIGIAGMPFAWYAILSNHSYWHFWFTFRELSISVFAILMIAVSCNKKYQGGHQ